MISQSTPVRHASDASSNEKLHPMDLSIVVPTYNEKANIALLLKKVEIALVGLRWELIFVDDDSPDQTADEVRRLAQEDPRARVIQRIRRRGLSSACIEGLLSTSAPILAVMDADLQHDEAILPLMYKVLLENDIDLVVATRNSLGGSKGHFARHRVWISNMGAALSQFLCKVPVSDPMSGFFMLRRECFHEAVHNLTGVGFKILVDLMASSTRPLRVREVPYTFRDRKFGESKLDLNVGLEYLNLVIEKSTHGFIPGRFVIFGIVGGTGVFVHLFSLTLLFKGGHYSFALSQLVATLVAMTWNFFLNNFITFRENSFRGVGLLRGLTLYYLSCSFGAFTSLSVAQYVFGRTWPWLAAGMVGVIVSSVWNYVVNSIFTWRVKTRKRLPMHA